MLRVAINGFGRIGRNILRALYQSGYRDRVQIVAINDLGNAATCAHLLEFDSVHGHFDVAIRLEEELLAIGDDAIILLSEPDPHKLPWRELDIDVVFECSGRMTSGAKAGAHLQAGAAKVLISAPAEGVDATVVYGVNENVLHAEDCIVSNASCTTNCLAPVAKVLHENFGIEEGSMTTIHAYTNDQHLLDLAHDDLYRARAAALSMIPTRTGAAKAIGLVLPGLDGKIAGMAVRVPTANVSLVDLVLRVHDTPGRDEVNAVMRAAAAQSPVLNYNDRPLVSVDFNGNSASSIFDANHTHAQGHLLHVMAWYDNEWGFAHRMLDTGLAMLRA
ncbi:type I glyceraldehyde-3-phosphate dehydrogenase [Thalassolituus sp. LLYu03]|uniref:type I glyceraldehyde-3-phosphate dehydrogenase n=1 Tax=Thalassolituus sp. LLYu03 TaxID=3421656 RepID=UPI003D265022